MMSEDGDFQHEGPSRRLETALQGGKLAHAYLMVGPTGSGRTELARTVAAAVLCEGDTPGMQTCGECSGCRAVGSGNHPDYGEVGIPEGKQELPIGSIRAVQRQASMKPVMASRRVFVLKDAEGMNTAAANCFLKTLEEPPGAALFLLIATGLRSLPATVVSRCQVVKVAPASTAELQQKLEAEGIEREKARWLARKSGSSPGLARQMEEMDLYLANEKICEALNNFSKGDQFLLSDLLLEEASARSSSRAEQRDVLQDLLECVACYYRDLAVTALGEDAELLNSAATYQQTKGGFKFTAFVEGAGRALEASNRIADNANERLALDALFTRVAELVHG